MRNIRPEFPLLPYVDLDKEFGTLQSQSPYSANNSVPKMIGSQLRFGKHHAWEVCTLSAKDRQHRKVTRRIREASRRTNFKRQKLR